MLQNTVNSFDDDSEQRLASNISPRRAAVLHGPSWASQNGASKIQRQEAARRRHSRTPCATVTTSKRGAGERKECSPGVGGDSSRDSGKTLWSPRRQRELTCAASTAPLAVHAILHQLFWSVFMSLQWQSSGQGVRVLEQHHIFSTKKNYPAGSLTCSRPPSEMPSLKSGVIKVIFI